MTLNPPSSAPAAPIDVASVDTAITSRMSVRAFLPQPVPRETIEHLLRVASRAPSGTNTQPWKVYVLQGASRDALVEECCAAHDALRADPSLASEYREEYDYYPEKWVSPYIDRRRENGWGLYGLLGITKGDKDKMHAQHQRNFCTPARRRPGTVSRRSSCRISARARTRCWSVACRWVTPTRMTKSTLSSRRANRSRASRTGWGKAPLRRFASPPRGLRTAAPSLPAQAWTGRRVSGSDADAACKAHQPSGKASPAVAPVGGASRAGCEAHSGSGT